MPRHPAVSLELWFSYTLYIIPRKQQSFSLDYGLKEYYRVFPRYFNVPQLLGIHVIYHEEEFGQEIMEKPTISHVCVELG